ncbi:response regulator transcription factor [Paenibacillus lycopersici]|uniref:Response regulator transcription factor n=1 Tax=Paenibacillus lycopersici TaxID=2704462 RepID=A0A6C0FUZ1_9BACL|nr:response regulator transcription factor [Paenibacillus lycopersici]QHT60956.1 response regulator transcription factor [Paenibacillus lycopersici]
MKIKLLLADDHAMVRKGLHVFLATQTDMTLVGEAATGQETLEQAALLQPDIVLMDLNMPVLNGIEATRQLKRAHPAIKVIVLTSFADQDHALPAIRAGARGYLLKDIEPDELASAIRRVYLGQVELHPSITGQLMDMMAAPDDVRPSNPVAATADPLSELTRREREVLAHIAQGKSNKEIGEALFITERTVKTHVSHLLDKLGMADRTQAAIYAVKQGFADGTIAGRSDD